MADNSFNSTVESLQPYSHYLKEWIILLQQKQ